MVKANSKERHAALYSLKYPHHLDWDKRIWVTQKGHTLRHKETLELYEVKQVLKSVRSSPKLIIESCEKVIYQ